MDNLEKYDGAFIEALAAAKEQLEGLEYQQIASWDSVGHMELVADRKSVV